MYGPVDVERHPLVYSMTTLRYETFGRGCEKMALLLLIVWDMIPQLN